MGHFLTWFVAGFVGGFTSYLVNKAIDYRKCWWPAVQVRTYSERFATAFDPLAQRTPAVRNIELRLFNQWKILHRAGAAGHPAVWWAGKIR